MEEGRFYELILTKAGLSSLPFTRTLNRIATRRSSAELQFSIPLIERCVFCSRFLTLSPSKFFEIRKTWALKDKLEVRPSCSPLMPIQKEQNHNNKHNQNNIHNNNHNKHNNKNKQQLYNKNMNRTIRRKRLVEKNKMHGRNEAWHHPAQNKQKKLQS